jgi:hypothetical protein
MDCRCESYSCVSVGVNPCNVGTSLGIEAAMTGNYIAWLEFNGTVTEFGVAATEGEDIAILTSLLNEQYTHELRLTDPMGDIRCYKVKTYPSFTASGAPVIPVDNDTWQWGQVFNISGNTVDSELLTGDISPYIWLNEQPLDWEEQGITQTATGLLFPYTVSGILGFQYKNLP